MIQIALLGRTSVVVDHGLRKAVPTKLFILHTENQPDYQYESEANRLKDKITSEYNITVELLKVGAFDMEGVIKTILGTIIKEKKMDSTLTKKDFVLNLVSAHNKEEVLTNVNQSAVYQYIIDSIRLTVMINKSYFMFLDSVKKNAISGSTDSEYYFALDEDKYSVQPVRVSSLNRQRIIGLLEDSNSIDLSSVSSLEQRYTIEYRELFAILSDLLNGSTPGIETKVIKKNEPVIVLKVKRSKS